MGSASGWRAVVGTVAFLAAGWLLLRLGRLEWMRVDWSNPSEWLVGAETEVALAALGRWAALALLGWIGVTTAGYLLARLLGVEARTVRWLTIGPVRRTIDALLAGYMVLGTVAPAGAAAHPQAPPTTATQEAVDPAYVPVPAGPAPQVNTAEEVENEEVVEEVATVMPGDHLWKLAAQRMEESLGRPPTAAEVAPYWMAVVEANRERIRSGDPDLIFPGEEIVLPPLLD